MQPFFKAIEKWTPHEKAFGIFFGTVAVRFVMKGGRGIFFVFLAGGLLFFLLWLRSLSRRQPRWEPWLYLSLMLITYQFCGAALPSLHPGGNLILANLDEQILGKAAACYLEDWITPLGTDVCYGLYLFFFVYLGISLWGYARSPLDTLKRYDRGLFSIYGIGFLGYSFLPAGGPYLEIPNHFSKVLHGGAFSKYAEAAVMIGTNRVDCFPCLHLAVSLFILLFDFWHCRRRFHWMIVPCAGIWFSTIYLRQHYLVDLLAGVGLAFLGSWLARPTIENNDVGRIKIN